MTKSTCLFFSVYFISNNFLLIIFLIWTVLFFSILVLSILKNVSCHQTQQRLKHMPYHMAFFSWLTWCTTLPHSLLSFSTQPLKSVLLSLFVEDVIFSFSLLYSNILNVQVLLFVLVLKSHRAN